MRNDSTGMGWKRRFLLLPRCVEGKWHWLKWCWSRFCGDCTEWVFEEPPCSVCGGGPVFCRHCMDRRGIR